jgi:hypothetical protein
MFKYFFETFVKLYNLGYDNHMPSIEVNLSEQLNAEVKSLASTQGISEEQVARRAVAVLSFLRDEAASGAQIILAHANGTETEIVGLAPAASL